VVLSELLLSELHLISTVLRQSVLQAITPILKITLPIADSKCVSDELVSKLEISPQVDSAICWLESALPTEYGKEEPKDWSLALALGLGLGVFFVFFDYRRLFSLPDSSSKL
jgi:hypothetical protein